MSYRLRDEVYFCWADGRAVFLDARRDRYFCLAPSLERAFRDLCQHDTRLDADGAKLSATGLLTACDPKQLGVKSLLAPTPQRNIADEAAIAGPSSLPIKLEVGWTLAMAKIRLQRCTLLDTIQYLRRQKTAAPTPERTGLEPWLRAATDFRAARRWVPIRPICLADSIALLQFLRRRRLAADLVFGVKLNPFSAHCWVQAEDVILNDHVEFAQRHTQILVV